MKIFDKIFGYFDKPTRDVATFLWYDEPLVKFDRRAEGSEEDGIFTNRDLMERKYKAEEGEDAAFLERVNNFIDMSKKPSKAANAAPIGTTA